MEELAKVEKASGDADEDEDERQEEEKTKETVEDGSQSDSSFETVILS